MPSDLDAPKGRLFNSWLQHAQQNVFTALALGAALAVLVGLLWQGLPAASDNTSALRLALLGSSTAFLATAVGALPGLIVRRLPQSVEDVQLGFAAGMMLAASAFSLLLPGLAAAEEQLASKPMGAGVVVIGMVLGVLLMLGMDAFTPHEHDKTGPCGPGQEYCSRLLLFVFAIALHNVPEGMAIGASFARQDLTVGVPVTTAIALQDMPEGLAVALAMRRAGFGAMLSVGIAIATGLLEPVGAVLGVAVSTGFPLAYPIGLGLAAGAMLFVVSHEVIPETHRNGHQTPATVGLTAGFALMMVLDTALA